MISLQRVSRFPAAARRGVALVITLAMVVLLTFLLVAFFSAVTASQRSESSRTGGVAAGLLAQGALAAIHNDLQAEIAAKSTVTAVGTSGSVYIPNNFQSMIPERMVFVSSSNFRFYNLVKQSGSAMFTSASAKPPVFNFASDQSTAERAINGRAINRKRWSAPMLTGTDLIPAHVPRWIYVNPDGYSALPTPKSIGRIAYNIYDIGGLLDANVAGFALANDGSIPAEAPTKGPAIWADLRGLGPERINAAAIDSPGNLAWPPQWRLAGDWKGMISGTTGTNSLAFYQRTGWLQPFPGTQPNPSDRMFTSRQDLIRFARANAGAMGSSKPFVSDTSSQLIPALQYLTTFSRDVERPSFEPDPSQPRVKSDSPGGGNNAYGHDSEINVSLPTATNADGEPTIKKRFPLCRLANVATPTPGASVVDHPKEALDQFGLTWQSTSNAWKYDHGGGPGVIYHLNQIPKEREPDFFELLKAAVMVGSLGKQLGFLGPLAYSGTDSTGFIPASVFPYYIGKADGDINYQIIQIGANIIDQADTDSFPTRLSFNDKMFYGVENLPRLYRIREEDAVVGQMTQFAMREVQQPPSAPIGSVNLMVTRMIPELWNPHHAPSRAKTGPTKFRITCDTARPIDLSASSMWKEHPTNTGTNGYADPSNYYHGAPVYWNDFRKYPGTTGTSGTLQGGPDCRFSYSYQTAYGASSSQADAPITFTYAGNESCFWEPCPFSSTAYPPGVQGVDAPDMGVDALSEPVDPATGRGYCDTIVKVSGTVSSPGLGTEDSHSALGFVIGYLPKLTIGGTFSFLSRTKGTGGPVAMELQYEDPSKPGTFWPMDRMNCGYSPEIFQNQVESWVATRADPRTERWGSLYDRNNASGQSALAKAFPFFKGLTENPNPGTFCDRICFPNRVPFPDDWPGIRDGGANPRYNEIQRNLPSNPYYFDPDGVARGATGVYSTMTPGSGGGAFTYGWPMQTGTSRPAVPNNNNSRPVILDRPFRSVAELGMVFRDTPWRNLDMMTPQSGDRALLDVFCLTEGPPDQVVAGRVNLNTRQTPVIRALVQGAGLLPQSGTSALNPITADTDNIAGMLTAFTSETPLRNRSELIGRVAESGGFVGPAHTMGNRIVSPIDQSIDFNRVRVMAALADVGTTRAWNLFTDIIAQSGVVTANGRFVPQGEARVWNSVAIDRVTGKVIDQTNETPTE